MFAVSFLYGHAELDVEEGSNVRTIFRALLFTALALASLCDDARAWSDPGHKIICEIAFRLAQQDTRAAIRKLLETDTEFKTFADSCVFPDHPFRGQPENPRV
jgi:hypothetical protein